MLWNARCTLSCDAPSLNCSAEIEVASRGSSALPRAKNYEARLPDLATLPSLGVHGAGGAAN